MVKQWAIVTGAANGIGLALSKTLIQTTDLYVLAVDKDSDGLTNLAAEFPDRLQALHTDLSNLSCIETVSKSIPEEDVIKFVVHNAAHVAIKLFKDVTPELMDYAFKVNFISSFFLTQKLFPRLDRDKSRVLLIGANPGITPQVGLSVYGLSKAANLHMYKTFKTEFAETNIRSAHVMLSAVDTNAFHEDAHIARELNLPLAKLLDMLKKDSLTSPWVVAKFYKFLLCDTQDEEFEETSWHIKDQDHWARWK